MKRFPIVVAFSLLFLVTGEVSAQQFVPGCPQLNGQIRTLQQSQPIDSTCPRQGEGQAPSLAQNFAKNNFCASNQPVEVNITTLRKLEARTQAALTQAHIPFGNPTNIPPNRTILQQNFNPGGVALGEGRAVKIVAFVLDSHYSNLKKGENVNCTTGGKTHNDIHVSLGATPTSDECFGVNAEISPHFRPTTWADFDDWEFTHPLMFVGQLFYDASHKPCTQGHPVNPARISSWEIHPVYSIFVCKNATLQACHANNGNDWWPFDEWINLPDDEEQGHHPKRKSGTFWAIKDLLYRPVTSDQNWPLPI